MMNKSAIDWCDFTWNPITGCRHTCEYCYARRQAKRFSGDVRVNLGTSQISTEKTEHGNLHVLPQPFKSETGTTILYPAGFEPTLHEYRLPMPAQKKKPANIFVCSMADLFGAWVPDEWIFRVFEAAEAAPWHNYLFLTKNPQRYCDLANAGKLPKRDNFWYGTTVTKKTDRIFSGSIRHHTFISIEPLTEHLEAGLGSFSSAEWIIVGAETGNRKGKIAPKLEWIENIIETARITHAAVLLKDSEELKAVWKGDLIQEFPKSLQHHDAPIPHCDECEHCTTEQQGQRGMTRKCEIGWEDPAYDDRNGGRHIDAKYARTSPPWCPKRNDEEA